jgi:nitrogen fixation protein NifB
MTALPASERHPCFFAGAQGQYGRIHLPVAASCNLVCAYCRRDTDCLHESRPGVTSQLMTPQEALAHLDRSLAAMPYLSVAGVAGPGDPFCEPEPTLTCLEIIRQAHPGLLLCVASNGLNLPPHIPRLAELGVRFVTLTINALEPAVAARLHLLVKDRGRTLSGPKAGALLIQRQLEALSGLKAVGVTVKINTVLVPGINEGQVVEVARMAAGLEADLMNLIPLIPVAGTPLAGAEPPSKALIHRLRQEAGAYIPQMTHCRRCRADAAGLL